MFAWQFQKALYVAAELANHYETHDDLRDDRAAWAAQGDGEQ